MKHTIKFCIICAGLSTILLFSGCQSDFLQAQEQPDLVIEETAKIYPSQVGNVLTDKKVEIPAIDKFMEEYNQNAKEQSKINYDCIRYNSTKGYYYVNDIQSSRGIKFRLNKSNQIISAAVYSGDISDKQTDLVDMVATAAQTLGYKTLMSDADKDKINSVIGQYNATQGKINQSLPYFENGLNLTMNIDNLFADIEIEAMVFNEDFVSDAEQNVQNNVNEVKDKNKDNPANPNSENEITLGDSFKDKYQNEIQDKLGANFEMTTAE